LAVAWGLEKAKYFTQSCDNLLVVTDHKPLTKIFGDRTLDKILNTRLFRLKQRTLLWHFNIMHLPGKSYCAADAASRYLAQSNFASLLYVPDSLELVEEAFLSAIQQESSQKPCLQWNKIAQHTASDPSLINLLIAIESDFDTHSYDVSCVQQYLPYRDGYYIHDNVIYNDRMVIPPSLRQKVLGS